MERKKNNQTNGKKESERHVEAVLSALKILDLFEFSSKLRLKDITEQTSLNRSRVIRLCGTLQSMGYLTFIDKEMSYTLGTRIRTLGEVYERSHPLYSIVKPILKELSLSTKETTTLFIISHNKRLCLARSEGSEPIRFSMAEGVYRNLYQGASSKVLLAYATDDLQRSVHQEYLQAHPEVKLSFKEFKAQLNEICKQSYAYSEGEVLANLSALSYPVRDQDGHVCASMTILGPTFRFTPENKAMYLEKLKNSAALCSSMLGYSGS